MNEPGVENLPSVLTLKFPVPALIAAAGDKASEHFLEFFAATIRNANTRAAYVTAVAQFCRWCQDNSLQLVHIRPLHVSGHIESKTKEMSPPSVKQHLAALRGLFNWLVIRQVVPDNPALFVKAPKFSRQVGITPIMESAQMRQLLDSIPITRKVKVPRKVGEGHKEVPDIKGLRDRAAIAIMAYTFARVSAVVGLSLGDYRLEGKRARLRLMEKGNKEKVVLAASRSRGVSGRLYKGGGWSGWKGSPFPVARQGAQADWRSPKPSRHAAHGEGALLRGRIVRGIPQSHV